MERNKGSILLGTMEMKKSKILTLVLVDVFLVITFIIYAPLELFLTNQREFWFTLSDITGITLIAALCTFGIIFLIGFFLRGKVFISYVACIFAVSLMLYLQGNFMNLDVGVMNGAEINWRVYTGNFIWNLGLWFIGIVFILVAANRRWNKVKKIVNYAAAFLSTIQIVSLIVVFLISSRPEKMEQMVISDKDIFNVSEEENIIVFLLDMYDDRYLKKILSTEPELVHELDGFTYFSNSVGAYSTTTYSMRMLFTGQYMYNKEAAEIEYNTAFDKSVMYPNLYKDGYLIDVYCAESFLPMNINSYLDNSIEEEYVISSAIGYMKRMYTLAACKYFPNIVKPFIWMDGNEFEILKEIEAAEYNSWSSNNITFYQNLKEQGISTDKEGKNFKFIYLDGVHYPYYIDENVNLVDEEMTSDIQCARGALRIVQEYIVGLKEQGVYDNTAIVILADHGYYWDGVLTNPVLLVKPMNEHGELKVSNAPVSQKDFQPSILSMAGLNENMKYGKSYFDIKEGEERERLFYQYYFQENRIDGNYRLIEYSVDSDGNKHENFHLTDVEYSVTGEKSTHKDKCQFCLSGEEVPIENEENWPIIIVHTPVE